jgi:hypothetical protein
MSPLTVVNVGIGVQEAGAEVVSMFPGRCQPNRVPPRLHLPMLAKIGERDAGSSAWMDFGEHLDIPSLLFFESRTTSSLTNNPPNTQAEACSQNGNFHFMQVGDKDVERRWFQKLLLGNPERTLVLTRLAEKELGPRH